MSSRSRASRARQHVHCDSCYSRRCRARVEPSVCCALIPCRLLCGALFHLCKEEEHLLLCPNVRVPCLNADYGCPLQMPRSSRAAHLQACPASVVCCSMEWNRWPVNDAHSHPTTELHENLLGEKERPGGLDLALALKDQQRLFHSLKMKKLFPELIQNAKKEEREDEKREEERRKERERKKKAALEKEAAEKAAAKEASLRNWDSFGVLSSKLSDEKENDDEDDDDPTAENLELTQEEREALARTSDLNDSRLENYNAWERMFSMEMGGCREAGEMIGKEKKSGKGKGLDTLAEEDADEANCSKFGGPPNPPTCTSSSSCGPVEKPKKRFVYGYVEPMKIITVRTFKVPTSFSARHCRIRNPNFYKRRPKAVDTSDLGVGPDAVPVWEEVQASLLCSLEREQRGHLIAEAVSSDSLLTDEGTQTYNFLSAPFRSDTALIDLTVGKTPELHLQLQVESVTSRHHKANSTFTFVCGHTFQRREYGRHYKNVHGDIQMCVNGWFEQRCPLAYLGCTYSQCRFRPLTHEADVKYNQDLGCFGMCPVSTVSLSHPSELTEDSPGAQRNELVYNRGEEDSFSSLPYEVLYHIASFLDSLSLSQLALVSRYMRQVCWSLLQDRGMVSLRWVKSSSYGQVRWKVEQKIWEFSTLFSPVDTWCFRNVRPISEHIKTCPYNERAMRTEKICLPRVREDAKISPSCKSSSLVTLFHQKGMAI